MPATNPPSTMNSPAMSTFTPYLNNPDGVDGSIHSNDPSAVNNGVAGIAVLSNATASATGSTTANVAVDTDQDTGTLYTVLTATVTQPNSSQIIAGQDSAGAATDNASKAVTGAGNQVISLTGLTESTTYFAHYVHVTSSGNSNIITGSSFATTASGSFVNPWNAPIRTFYTSKDALDGNAAGDDTSGDGSLALPFATIQRGINALTNAGDELQVRAASTPYKEAYQYPGQDLVGIALSGAGTATDYTHVTNYPNERPVVSSGILPVAVRDSTTFALTGQTLYAGGIYFSGSGNSDYVNLNGIEVTDCWGFGTDSNHAGASQSSYIEKMYVHGIIGQSGNNVSGVRLDNMVAAHVRNNRIKGVYDLGRTIGSIVVNGDVTEITSSSGAHGYTTGDVVNLISTSSGSVVFNDSYTITVIDSITFSVPFSSGVIGEYFNQGNPIDSQPMGLDAGIHGYFPDNCKIYNNDISVCKRGVFQKSPSKTYQDSHDVYFNKIYDIIDPMYSIEVQGTGSARSVNAKFHENIGWNVGLGMSFIMNGSDSQSTGAQNYNNTIYDMVSAAGYNCVTDITHKDNIYHTSSFNDVMTTSRGFDSLGNPLANSYLESDYNTYYLANKQFILENNDPNVEYYPDLASWQLAFTNSTLVPAQLTTNPDVNSTTTDPLFTSIALNDFTLQAGSPDLTNSSTGGQRGAYGLGAALIGTNWIP